MYDGFEAFATDIPKLYDPSAEFVVDATSTVAVPLAPFARYIEGVGKELVNPPGKLADRLNASEEHPPEFRLVTKTEYANAAPRVIQFDWPGVTVIVGFARTHA